MLEFTAPVEHWGRKFDRGMIMFEFDALREPEATRFPQIGAWVRERCPMIEIPAPSMLWRGKLWPDLYIANQLAAVKGWRDGSTGFPFKSKYPPSMKAAFLPDMPLELASIENHGERFHDKFIEPFCRKITGRRSRDISAKFHRSVWLPLFWPQTLRGRQSIQTKFWYPNEGYAGAVMEAL